jgi:hypothetical protein
MQLGFIVPEVLIIIGNFGELYFWFRKRGQLGLYSVLMLAKPSKAYLRA